MSIRGELFTTQVLLDNRSYFFNVKENRAGVKLRPSGPCTYINDVLVRPQATARKL